MNPVRATTSTVRLHSPNPGQDPLQPPVPAPGEVPSPVRDVPPGQPIDPVPNQPIDTPPYQPTDPVRGARESSHCCQQHGSEIPAIH